MTKALKNEIVCHGLRVLRSRHRDIRKLKRDHTPAVHGFRVWASSWLLVDFFKHRGLKHGTQVMDVGCGWGLAGIYCAKYHHAAVTSVDIDSDVFPFLHLHAGLNDTKIISLQDSFDDISSERLENTEVLIGADICFWDSMVDSLINLICRALHRGVHLVVIADPGRSPFFELGDYFCTRGMGSCHGRWVQDPHFIQGYILKVACRIHS